MRSARPSLVALAAYLGISLLYFGLPILGHPGRDLVGAGTDPDLFVWALGWWPHAILHGENPIVTHAIWFPVGVNLAWVTSVPALAIALSPVTLLFGPAVSYNVVAILVPALDAFTAYVLCRHLTRRFWPSLAGGYLFGFSSYVLGQTEGHPHMSAVFLVPLIALVVVRRLERSLSRRRFVVWFGVLLALQYGISTEIFFTASLALAISLVAAYALLQIMRSPIRGVVPELLGAYGLACLLVSPLLLYALLHLQRGSINQPARFPGDLLNVVVPTHLTWLHPGWTSRAARSFQGNDAENGGYLGLPIVAIVCWYAWENRRRASAWLLVVLALIAGFLELGESLHVDGYDLFTLPWAHIATLPFFDNVLPVRFSMFVSLATAAIVALWAARSLAPRRLRTALVVAAVALLIPDVWLGAWHVHPERPAFFAGGLYRRCIAPGDSVLMLPWPSKNDAMLWQAEAGYSFRMANGYVSPVVPAGLADRVLLQALESGFRPASARPLLQVARDQGATTIAIAHDSTRWVTLFAGREQERQGVDLVNVPPHVAAPCPRSG